MWTPSHGRAKAGRPARAYLQQLCTDTECSLDDQPGAMERRVARENQGNLCSQRDMMMMMMMTYIRICLTYFWPSRLGQENTPTTFLTPSTHVLDMTLNNLMMWLQYCLYWLGVVAPDKDPINGSNRTKQCNYTKLNCLKQSCFTFNHVWTKKLYLGKTESFEIDQCICIKMDLALNNLQWLICH